jgi:hypothetical protein
MECHDVIDARLNNDSIRPRYQNRCHLASATVDGDLLGYGDGAESTGVESVSPTSSLSSDLLLSTQPRGAAPPPKAAEPIAAAGRESPPSGRHHKG